MGIKFFGSTFTNLVENIDLQDINTGIGNNTYVLELSAAYGYTVNNVSIISGAGTCTAALKINAVSITGLSAIPVSTLLTTAIAGTNTVSAGDKLTLILSSTSGLNNLQVSIKTTRI